MPTPSIIGVWSGEYSYAPGTPDPVGEKTVPFTVKVQEADFGEFSGRMTDDPLQGVPAEALVSGAIEGLRASFIKSYRTVYVARSPGGRPEPLRDQVCRRFGGELVGPEPEQNIYYRGLLSPDGQEMSGSWRSEPWHVFVRSGGVIKRIRCLAFSGQWWARRNAAESGILRG
jgi:hypothetical protein